MYLQIIDNGIIQKYSVSKRDYMGWGGYGLDNDSHKNTPYLPELYTVFIEHLIACIERLESKDTLVIKRGFYYNSLTVLMRVLVIEKINDGYVLSDKSFHNSNIVFSVSELIKTIKQRLQNVPNDYYKFKRYMIWAGVGSIRKYDIIMKELLIKRHNYE